MAYYIKHNWCKIIQYILLNNLYCTNIFSIFDAVKNEVNIQVFKFKRSNTELPLFLSNIQAGFPSPADDY